MNAPEHELPKEQYDAFLSHSSADKPVVEAVADRLVKAGLTPWLDKWNLVPGEAWQPALETALERSRACVVLVGPGPLGPWQNEEMRLAIDRRVADSSYRVVPVLLPGADRGPSSQLPNFLAAATWVEFRRGFDDDDAFHRLVCGIRGIAPGRGPGAPAVIGECPYPGLAAFQEQDAALFFGRDAPIGWLLDKLQPRVRAPRGGRRASIEPRPPGEAADVAGVDAAGRPLNDAWAALQTVASTGGAAESASAGPASGGPGAELALGRRFLAVVGASGSGKSSLVRAGLIPALRNGRLDGSAAWPIAVIKPGAQPLESLAVALHRTPGLQAAAPDVGGLIDRMSTEARRLHLGVRVALHDQPEEARAVVFVDQFEEVFTLCEDVGQRRAFIDNLMYAALLPVGPTIVVIAMRSDFYGKCAVYPDLLKALSDDRQVFVGPMTAVELREAIERPAELGGRELEPGLTELLLNDVERQPGALPLMQHALRLLWTQSTDRTLTVAAYEALGKVDGALEKHATAVYDAFSPEEQGVCRRVFERLTQPGEGTEDTKRRARREEFGPGPAVDRVIDRLAQARLITADHETVEVSHEALTRSWSKLREWIDGRRAAVKLQNALSEAAYEWEANHRNEAYLYRGARLVAAEEWARDDHSAPSPLERAFLGASVTERDRAAQEKADQQARELRLLRWQRGASMGLVAAMVMFGLAVYFRESLELLWKRREFYPYTLSTAQVLALPPKQTFRDCDPTRSPPLCPEMVVVPAGSFMMGSEDGRDEERPVHEVTFARPFAVSTAEVTFDDWAACFAGGGCLDASDSGWGRADRPVINVSWDQAQGYARWLSAMTGAEYRLLSEAEWEYAARAGSETKYWWGDAIGKGQANCYGCGSEWDGRQTAPVRSFEANRFGLYDVHGNVQEWVQDCWQPSYDAAPIDGAPRIDSDQSVCQRAVVRGGSWSYEPSLVRSAIRDWLARGNQYYNLGFRIARTLSDR